MENLFNDLVYGNTANNTSDEIDLSFDTNVDKDSEIENGIVLDYLEVFGYQEDIV